jgi:hypothetical protein
MILAIDYDNTFSDYKQEFTALRIMFQENGHKVFIVTARNAEKEPIPEEDCIGFDRVFYTSGKAKAHVVRADIWIDDSPVTLCCDFVPGEAKAKPSHALHQGYKDTHVLWNYEDGKFVSYVSKTLDSHAKKG